MIMDCASIDLKAVSLGEATAVWDATGVLVGASAVLVATGVLVGVSGVLVATGVLMGVSVAMAGSVAVGSSSSITEGSRTLSMKRPSPRCAAVAM